MQTIKLKQATTLTTGYRGRGIPSKAITIPAGGEVRYHTQDMHNLKGEFKCRYHCIETVVDGVKYTASKREELLYPPTVWSFNHESGCHCCGKAQGEKPACLVPYDLYADALKNHKCGDVVVHHASNQGTGKTTYQITRMDATGVYAVCLECTVRELTIEEVR